MRKEIFIGAIAFSVVIVMSGCSSSMTKEAAAEKYLDVVCPVNLIVDSVETSLAGTDIDSINMSASKYRDALQAEAKVLGDESIPWPPKVKPLMEQLSKELIPAIDVFNQFATAKSFDEMDAIKIPQTSMGETTQELRIELDLPSNLDETCLSR